MTDEKISAIDVALSLVLSVLIVAGVTALRAQQRQSGVWSGTVKSIDLQTKTLTVESLGSKPVARAIRWDEKTRWVEMQHGKTAEIDPSKVKAGDTVVVLGEWNQTELLAKVVNKRLPA
jgi:hypothetical protein